MLSVTIIPSAEKTFAPELCVLLVRMVTDVHSHIQRLFNRNDQQEFLLIKTAENEDGGLFRMFAAGDFFSDRAIKSVSGIHLGY